MTVIESEAHFKCSNQLYLEEGHGGSIPHCSVFNPGLLRQVVRRVDGGVHSLHGQEGSQVGRVGGDDDQGKEPPDTPHYTSGQSLGHQLRA